MHKKKNIFVTFEGIEGSGKSYQSKKLFQNLKKKNIPVFLTREPGGSKGAEKIRKLILTGAKNKFFKTTDTLLYLAARNQHIQETLKPIILKKNIICDRFIDSTLAYQVYGKGVDIKLVNNIHHKILGDLQPDLTIVLKVDIAKAFERLNKRKFKNRYDKFSKDFYKKVQNSFLKISKKNKKKYFVINNSMDSKTVEEVIINKFFEVFEKK